MREYPKKKMPAISHRDALAAVRKYGSARAAAEALGASFKTICRRVNEDLGMVTATIPVDPGTKDALSQLTERQWDLLESTVQQMAAQN